MKKINRNTQTGLTIINPIAPAIPTAVYDSYWRFAVLRQEIFFNRLYQSDYPWTSDPILSEYKFTNAYRASDRVSQYLIRKVIYDENAPSTSKEILFRVLLFKLFNKIETWELLKQKFGQITFEEYKFENYDEVLMKTIKRGKRIYSAAYIMPSGQSYFGFPKKHSNHLRLIELMMNDNADEKLMNAQRMQDAFEIIKGYPGLGDFLAYQFLIDINYSTLLNFSESEFVVPGPGAKGGISKCFASTGGLNNVDIIKWVTDRQEQEFDRLGLAFKSLWGRPLQLIDCQNIFCEVDKYARVKHPDIKGDSDRTRIKQKFKFNSAPIDFWFPPKWGINNKISKLDLKSTII